MKFEEGRRRNVAGVCTIEKWFLRVQVHRRFPRNTEIRALHRDAIPERICARLLRVAVLSQESPKCFRGKCFQRNFQQPGESEIASPEEIETRETFVAVEGRSEDEKRGDASMISVLDVLTVLLILGDLEAITVVHHHPKDQYVEHEVLREDALAEAKKLEIYPGPIPGCKTCTDDEMTYCKDGSVINDHCCCEGSSFNVFPEAFPFVEHTCRLGLEECKMQAEDCAEYTRLRDCCCHSYLAAVWKYKATGGGSRVSIYHIKFLTILTVLTLHQLLI